MIKTVLGAGINKRKRKGANLSRFGISDSDELLGNDRKHFNVDTVKFIEAAPGAGLGQTREESTHHLVVQTV